MTKRITSGQARGAEQMSTMKNVAATIPAVVRASSDAASTVSRKAHSIGAGIVHLMTAGILATLLTFILPAPAAADPLGFTRVTCSGVPFTAPVTQSQSCVGTEGDAATANLGGPSARASGSALDGTYTEDEVDLRYGATAQTSYDFLAVAPENFDPFTKVPVKIDAFLSTGATATEGDFLYDTFSKATLLVNSDPLTYLAAGACSGYPCGGPATLDVSEVVGIYPSLLNEVTLTATVELDSLFASFRPCLRRPLHTNRSSFPGRPPRIFIGL